MQNKNIRGNGRKLISCIWIQAGDYYNYRGGLRPAAIIDTTIVNIALPTMQGSLGASLTEITWVITAYAIANVIVMPMTSWLSQQFGRRNYFAASIMIFTFT